jgi:prefoldin subunit 5
LNTLLKRREENGRFLAEELKNLHATKERLQNNITHIQQIKTQLEYKINNELREAQEKS